MAHNFDSVVTTTYQTKRALEPIVGSYNCFKATIVVKNLDTHVCVSPSPMLIWVLQSSQCSKIRVAQLCEGEGQFEWEQTCEECIYEIFEKIQEKRFLFQWCVTSIVVFYQSKHCMMNSEFRERLPHYLLYFIFRYNLVCWFFIRRESQAKTEYFIREGKSICYNHQNPLHWGSCSDYAAK